MTTTPQSLLQELHKHRLLTAAQLQQLAGALGRYRDTAALLQDLVRRGWLTAYQADQLARGQVAELVIGPYLVLDVLGEGGFGLVFKARHQAMNRLVALKTLRRDLLTDEEAVQRFHREIEMLGQVNSPHIVRAYDAGVFGNTLVLALEFVDGVNLEELVERHGPLPVVQACSYIRQAAVGLAHAQQKGLVHRDLKPANLLLSTGRQPIVKILDFGLGRLMQPPQDSKSANLTILSGGGITQGSIDYLSPEQAIDFHAADVRADIYSLGCTLWHLLTGRPPYPDGTVAEKLMKHQQAEPPDLRQQRPDAPVGLAAVLRKMLARRLPDRYQTPQELAAALAPFAGEPAGAAQPRPHRQRRLALAGLALLLGSLAALGLSWSGTKEPQASRPLPPVAPITIGGPATVKAAGRGKAFGSAEQMVVIPHDPVLDPEQLTFEAWFRMGKPSGGLARWIGGKNVARNQETGGFGMHITGNRLIAVLDVGNSAIDKLEWPARELDLEWHHLAMTFDGAALKLYFDGKLVGSKILRRQRVIGGDALTIGGRLNDDSRCFPGRLDDIRLYDRPLSAQEILQHFQKPDETRQNPGPGLLRQWSF